MQKVLSPATYVCSHWMFFRSDFISARTAFDFCAAARSASRSALPMAGMARSMTYLGMTFAPSDVSGSLRCVALSYHTSLLKQGVLYSQPRETSTRSMHD